MKKFLSVVAAVAMMATPVFAEDRGPSNGTSATAVSGSQSGAVSSAGAIAGGGTSIATGGDGGSAGAMSSLSNSTTASNALQSSPTAAVTINQTSTAPRQIIPGEVIISPTNNTAECLKAKSGGIGFPYGSIGGSSSSTDEDCAFRVRTRDISSYAGSYGPMIATRMFCTHYADVRQAVADLGLDCNNLRSPVAATVVAPVPAPKQEETQIDPPALGQAGSTKVSPAPEPVAALAMSK